MQTLRSFFIQKRACHGFTGAKGRLFAPKNAASTPATFPVQTVLSRSRPPPPAAEQTTISRLPAPGGLSLIRLYCSESALNDGEVQRKVEDISEKFKEAMELLDDARGSVGTVYFSDDMTDAEDAIGEVLADYDRLMKQMNESQRRSVVRTIGLKIEELKAQVQMLRDSLKE